MADYYIDASALAKRYVQESGSGWVLALTNPQAGVTCHTVAITGAEVMSARVRKMRTGSMTLVELQQAAALLRRQWRRTLNVRDVSSDIVDRAMDLVERHGLRGYDAVHLATALAVSAERQCAGLSALVFISADRTQLQAARTEGLAGENPNDFP